MKYSHLLSAITICVIATLSGCGGSGTPLPAAQKSAKITFISRTSVAKSVKGSMRINDFLIQDFIVPNTLSIPTISGGNDIHTEYISNGASGSYFPSYAPPATNGKVSPLIVFTDANLTDLELGKSMLYLTFNVTDVTMSQAALKAFLESNNANRIALAALCPVADACALNPPKTNVFYNISVSIQNRK